MISASPPVHYVVAKVKKIEDFSELKNRNKMDVPAKDKKYRPVDSTIFLSEDRLYGHSTRPHNFQVTNTKDLQTD